MSAASMRTPLSRSANDWSLRWHRNSSGSGDIGIREEEFHSTSFGRTAGCRPACGCRIRVWHIIEDADREFRLSRSLRSGRGFNLGKAVEFNQPAQQPFQVLERDHIGSIGGRPIRILVGLDENAGGADGDGRTRQHADKLPFTTRGRALSARLLDRMGGIKNDRRSGGCVRGSAVRAYPRPACCSRTMRRAQSPAR